LLLTVASLLTAASLLTVASLLTARSLIAAPDAAKSIVEVVLERALEAREKNAAREGKPQ